MKDYKLSKDGKTLLRVDTHILGHFDVLEDVEEIGDEAFEGCESLKFIIIQNPKVYSEHKTDLRDVMLK